MFLLIFHGFDPFNQKNYGFNFIKNNYCLEIHCSESVHFGGGEGGFIPYFLMFTLCTMIIAFWNVAIGSRFLFCDCKIYHRSIEVMAAAEARAAWQRTATRCYVHEDAREKFSYCSSSSYSSKSESDHAPDNTAKEPYNIIPDYVQPFPNSDVLTGRRWWLNQEPNFGHLKNFISEEKISSETELEIISNDICEENQPKEGFVTMTGMKNNAKSSLEQVRKVSGPYIENGQDTRMQDFKAVISNSPKYATGKDVSEFWYLDDHLMNLDTLNCLVSQDPKKLSSDFESHWVGADKTEPWWRSAGKDDLASLVAQKSLEHIENCDLPRPRATKNYRKQPCSQNFEHDDILPLPSDWMAETRFSNLRTLGSPNSGCSPLDSEQTFR